MKFKYWLLVIGYWLLVVNCFGDFYANGRGAKRRIALSFDDGPSIPYTEKVLDILKKENVKATFFVTGMRVNKYPEIVKKIILSGHELGNHTYNHINFYSYKKNDIKEKVRVEVEKTEESIFNATGIRLTLIRFPYGYCKKWAVELLGKKGYTIVNWSYGYDWKNYSPDEIKKKYIEKISPGVIFLMHDGWNSKVIPVLPEIISELKKKNYEIVTISELLDLGGQNEK